MNTYLFGFRLHSKKIVDSAALTGSKNRAGVTLFGLSQDFPYFCTPTEPVIDSKASRSEITMGTAVTSSKRVAKNTLFLYIRMLVVMLVTFYTSRVVLEALGVDGYGVYTLVGGLAFSFGFFSSSLSNATQRYLSFAHGTGKKEEVSTIFNATATIYILLGGAVLFIGCIIGPFLIGKVKIPSDLISAAYWVYYCTIISLSITLTATMFDSVLIARENMKVYAYLSILDVIGKLGIAYLILTTPSYRLIIYALAQMILSIIVKSITIYFCLRNYKECHIKLHWDKPRVKELMGFISWNGLATLVFAINEQGVNLLLNIFFGPVVNAARGIASQVNAAITHFSSNFLLAVSPQMMKSYAAKEMKNFISLFFNSGKYSFSLLWLLFLPIILRRNYILHFWLTDVPEYTNNFLLWIIIYSLINVFYYPQWFAVQAHGLLKKYILITNIIYIGIIPIAWLFLGWIKNPVLVFQIMVIDRIFVVAASLLVVRSYISFSIRGYLTQSVLPGFLMVIVTFPIATILNKFIPDNFIGLIEIGILTILLNLGSLWVLVFNKEQRKKAINLIKTKFIRRG